MMAVEHNELSGETRVHKCKVYKVTCSISWCLVIM